MKKRREGKYILIARNKNVFAGLRHWGVVFWSGAVVGEAWKAVQSRQVVFDYGRMSSDGPGEPRHGLHIVVGEVYEEALGVLVF